MTSDNPAVASTVVTLILDYPPKALSPNGRPNRYELAEAKRKYRYACKVDALNVRNTLASYPLVSPVTARIVFVIPKGDLPDQDNCIASIKAGIDGIVDSKLITDDSPDHFRIEDVLVTRGTRREVRVTLRGAS